MVEFNEIGEIKTDLTEFAEFKDRIDHCTILLTLMQNTKLISKLMYVYLSDGSIKIVSSMKEVSFIEKLISRIVLYIPGFKHNLLFVHELLKKSNIFVIFYSSYQEL